MATRAITRAGAPPGSGRKAAGKVTAVKAKGKKTAATNHKETAVLAPGYAVLVTSIKERAGRAKTVDALIKALGGPLTVGRAAHIDHSSVSQWKRDGYIPPARVPLLAELFDLPISLIGKFARKDET